MNIKEQSEIWLAGLAVRKLRSVKPGTLRTYKSLLNARILPIVGDIQLADFKNAAMKSFVAALSRSGLSASAQLNIIAVVKEIVASAVNEEGDLLYPRVWNAVFIDAPQVVLADRKTPTATVAQIEAAKNPFWYFLGGTGLRISEARAMRYGDDGVHTAWDADNALVTVRTQVNRGLEQPPKTPAAIREVDLPQYLNNYLKENVVAAPGFLVFPGSETTQRDRLAEDGIPGFHALRRHRITHLRGAGAPEDILRFWVGHAPENVTDRYSKLAQDIGFRKEWAEKIGVGFKLGDKNAQS